MDWQLQLKTYNLTFCFCFCVGLLTAIWFCINLLIVSYKTQFIQHNFHNIFNLFNKLLRTSGFYYPPDRNVLDWEATLAILEPRNRCWPVLKTKLQTRSGDRTNLWSGMPIKPSQCSPGSILIINSNNKYQLFIYELLNIFMKWWH